MANIVNGVWYGEQLNPDVGPVQGDGAGTPVPTIKDAPGAPSLPLSGVSPYPDPEKPLPANHAKPEGNKGNGINWLGSSYSGADIKVVAHLYANEQEDELKDIEDQAAMYRETAAALRNLRILRNTYPIPMSRNDFTSYNKGKDSLIASLQFPDSRTAVLTWARDIGAFTQTHPSIGDQHGYESPLTRQIEELEALANDLEKTTQPIKELLDASTDTKVLGTLQTISVQTHREKYPVRAIGTSYVKGYTKGPRTIAGSMIFTVFDEHVLKDFIRSAKILMSKYGEIDYWDKSLMPDQLPPIDLTIAFVNEYGSRSKMTIYGVEFINKLNFSDLFQ